jgi:hypothetical protein
MEVKSVPSAAGPAINQKSSLDKPSPEDVQARVDAVLKRAEEVAQQAQQAAETARKAGATFALVNALSLLIGVFVASAAAALGGRLRDDNEGDLRS